MFLGHFGVAFGAKKVAPNPSLGTLLLAAQLADFICPFLLLAGIEQVRIAPGATVVTPLDFTHYPYTHSLLALVAWAVLVAGICVWRYLLDTLAPIHYTPGVIALRSAVMSWALAATFSGCGAWHAWRTRHLHAGVLLTLTLSV